jgi:A/G-specific adenine glycosylase
LRFIEIFPNIYDLAQADEKDVLKQWEGLGYYSRARNLHFAAKQIVNEYNGVFPNTFDDILKLKGIGNYTASAIASIAYNLPHPSIDGNVFRVLARLFEEPTPINSARSLKVFSELVNVYFDKLRPSEFNQAMMEIGALICTPKSPKCPVCPIRNYCMAYEHKSYDNFPVKINKTKVKELFFYFLILNKENQYFIEQRVLDGIWKNLYQFPLIESDKQLESDEVEILAKELLTIDEIYFTKIHLPIIHLLSHRKLNITFIEIKTDSVVNLNNYELMDMNTIKKLAFPVVLKNFIERNML